MKYGKIHLKLEHATRKEINLISCFTFIIQVNCRGASMGGKRVTTEIFIERSNELHSFKYDYSESVFTSVREKIRIKCKEHGYFEQRASAHMTDGQGCPVCRRIKSSNTKINKTSKTILEKFKEVHGETYLYDDFVYNGDRKLSIITCRIHGNFKQAPNAHRVGKGCLKCSQQLHNYRRSNYLEKCNKSNNGESNIYVLEFQEETGQRFYKIGITIQELRSRFSASKMPYSYKTLRFKRAGALSVFNLELDIKKELMDFEYKPDVTFPGSRYECFTHIPDNIFEMIDSLV